MPVPFSSTLHVTTSSEHPPSFHDIFIHITHVLKPLRPHVPFCPASPSIGIVHLASSPLAAASRRSTYPSPLAHPPHFANRTPARATSENRSVKELDRSCSTSLLDLTRGGRGCWMSLCDVMGRKATSAIMPCAPLGIYEVRRSCSGLFVSWALLRRLRLRLGKP